jgi:hypothetical protein
VGADRTPYVAWHLDPLPPGSKNEVQIDIGKERAAREHMLEAAGWISSPQYADSEFFGKTPATELAYEWLWDDLRRVSWVKGMFNRRFSGFTSTSGSNKTAMFSLSSSSTRPGHCKCTSKTSNMLCGAKTAQDLGRYDFIKDIGRVENIVTDRAPRASGYVILLTNDPSY